MQKEMKLPMKESGEMYLESIYVLCKAKKYVRSIDVAEYMNYSKPSVSRGVGLLKKAGYIEVDSDGFISLTEEGTKMANKIFERHTVISRLLTIMGVDEETASEDACRMEHVISDKTLSAIKKYIKTIK